MLELLDLSHSRLARDAVHAPFAAVRLIRRHEDLLELGEMPPPAPGVLLGEHLLAAGVVSPEGLREALALQPRLPGRRLGWILTMLDHLKREDLDRVLAARMGVVTVSLAAFRPSADYSQRLTFETARRFGMVLLHEDERTSWVAVTDASDPKAREVASFALGKRVVLVQAGRRELDTYVREMDPRTATLRGAYYDAIQGLRGQQNERPLDYDAILGARGHQGHAPPGSLDFVTYPMAA